MTDTDITWDLQFPEHPPILTPSEQVQLFGIFQEAVTNVIKHAHATYLLVALDASDNIPSKWTFQIEDNGVGFDANLVSGKRYGLDIIASRARDMGTDLSVEANNGGTTVCITP